MEFTHKGWFGVCPVYLAEIETDAPLVEPRHWVFAPLFWFSDVSFRILIGVASIASPDYEPAWPIRVTGRLD